MNFIPREKAPNKANSNYYSNDNIYYKCNYSMPNCTCYAHGRYHEIFGVWSPCRGNANKWIDEAKKAKWETSKYPELGSVVVWDCKGGCGHVAIVEEIKNNGDIVCSNSAWGGSEFYMQTFKFNKNYAWTGSKHKYTLLGFIRPQKVFTETEKKLTVTGSLYLRKFYSKNSDIVTTMHRGDKFDYSGRFVFRDNVKWLYGKFDTCKGWASAKYMK